MDDKAQQAQATESKIRFLEETLAGKDWRATVAAPAGPVADDLQQEMQARGIGMVERTGQQGMPVVDLHHPTKSPRIKNLGNTAHKVGHWFNKSIHDPAQANGLINTTAEAFLTAAGTGSQYGKFTDKQNILLSLAGLSWLAQSLTYLIVAKSNEDTMLGQFKDKLDTTMQRGGDIAKVHYEPSRDREKPANPVVTFLRRYPVQIGAMLNNLGMGFFIAQAILLKKKYKGDLAPLNEAAHALEENIKKQAYIDKGFKHEIRGAITSLVGWTVLLIPPKKHDEKERQPDTIVAKGWNKFHENTPVAAGVLTLAASTQRLIGAGIRGNELSKIGEKLYIGGDVALMFTNSHSYGGKELHIDKLSAAMAEHIHALPIVLGPKAREEFVDNSVHYLRDKALAHAALHPDADTPSKEVLEQRAEDLKNTLGRKVRHQQEENFEHVCHHAARLIAKLPDSKQDAGKTALIEALHTLPWLHVTADELHTEIDHSLAKIRPMANKADTIGGLQQDMRDLVNVVPGIDLGASVSVLYDALAKYMGISSDFPQAEKVTAAVEKTPSSRVHAAVVGGPVARPEELAR